MTFLFYVGVFLFLILCVLLCFVVLIQESKSMGLGASFGGDSGDSLFGTSTAEVLKRFTAYLIGFFLISCVALSIWSSQLAKKKSFVPKTTIEEVQEK